MTTLRRPPNTVSCVNDHVQGGRAMSIDQAVDTIVTLRPDPVVQDDPERHATPRAAKEAAVITPIPEPPVPLKRQRRWLLPVAIGVAGVIAPGTMGGVLRSTIGQRDTARHQLVTSQQAVTTTRVQLTAANTDAATRKVTSDYVRLVTGEGGQAVADYATMAACNSFGQCRTA